MDFRFIGWTRGSFTLNHPLTKQLFLSSTILLWVRFCPPPPEKLCYVRVVCIVCAAYSIRCAYLYIVFESVNSNNRNNKNQTELSTTN